MSDTIVFDTEAALKNEPVMYEVKTFALIPENHPVLHEVLPEFDFSNPPVNPNEFASTLVETCKKHKGYGLSANQCGVSARVFVIGTNDFEMACINPKIINRSEETIKGDEGCLSFPGFYVKIARPSWIDVEFTDENGQVKQIRLEGLTARCFEHELDHMNGVVFTQYVGPVSIQLAKKKQAKILKTTQRNLKRKDGIFV